MATSIGQGDVKALYKNCKELEFKLRVYLQKQQRHIFDKDVVKTRLRLREAYEAVLLSAVALSYEKDIHQELWKWVFYKVIEEYRRRLRLLSGQNKSGKVDEAAAQPIEYRKHFSNFKAFLHESSGFYQQLIANLATRYGLEEVSKLKQSAIAITGRTKGRLPMASRSEQVSVKSSERRFAVESVYRSLIYLGDLSRYLDQHAKLPRHPNALKRSDGPDLKQYRYATLYYTDAHQLMPHYGNPFNQLAVISLYKEDKLSGIAYYYRSLACKSPFLTGWDNLRTLFMQLAQEDATEVATEVDRPNRFQALLRIHARIFLAESINSTNADAMVQQISDWHAKLFRPAIESRQLEINTLLSITTLGLGLWECLGVMTIEHRSSNASAEDEASKKHIQAQGTSLKTKQVQNRPLALTIILALCETLLATSHQELRATLEKEQSSQASPRTAVDLVTPTLRRLVPSLKITLLWIQEHAATLDDFGKSGDQIALRFWQSLGTFFASCQQIPHIALSHSTPVLHEDVEFFGFSGLQEYFSAPRFKHAVLQTSPDVGMEMEVQHRFGTIVSTAAALLDLRHSHLTGEPLLSSNVTIEQELTIEDESNGRGFHLPDEILAGLEELEGFNEQDMDDDDEEVVLFQGRDDRADRKDASTVLPAPPSHNGQNNITTAEELLQRVLGGSANGSTPHTPTFSSNFSSPQKFSPTSPLNWSIWSPVGGDQIANAVWSPTGQTNGHASAEDAWNQPHLMSRNEYLFGPPRPSQQSTYNGYDPAHNQHRSS
ncbi:hypothetical protein BZG36_02441 [Bifiguratus adelaidae]|uniref:DNA/RNA-binding domain-containing protein n=1 Tax=Bifiguratus adelaidae TaxID=1938954 RepID=A0A261Y3K1_9FUNG|nr:hypothetical protein BZG36_02441 [Bifiguratus adelaidae]